MRKHGGNTCGNTWKMICIVSVYGMVSLFLLATSALAAEPPARKTSARPATLQALAQRLATDANTRRTLLYHRLLARTDGAQGRLNANPDLQLMGIDTRGFPVVYTICNLNAARTVSTDDVWTGGGHGFSLDGSNTAGELGVWDAGAVLTSHQEFGGRCTVGDGTVTTHWHSTHVGGTLVATGIDPAAQGMSFQAQLVSRNWTDDSSEMAAAAAAGMLVSCHSYGSASGWEFDGSEYWWYGDTIIDENEDPKFGYYSGESQAWDQIAVDAPEYLICKAAGNDRNDSGPTPGEGYWVWNPFAGDWVWSTTERDPDGGADGYDTVPTHSGAKNVLTVGAVGDIPAGYSDPADVVMSSFSGWGPTDDGRIKPDLVANGIGLWSCLDDAIDSYGGLSGTSMATPSVAGSVNLLYQHHAATHSSNYPRSATMKAILIQTADQAGASAGPDYSFGWGLLNTLQAAQLIADDGANPVYIREEALTSGETDVFTVLVDGASPLAVTLVWTDQPGSPPVWSLNPTDRMLINDLDLRVVRQDDGQEFFPYVLNPAAPADPATTGDNVLDNVEKVHLAVPEPGAYDLVVTHKGTLVSPPQQYSLVHTVDRVGPPTTTNLNASATSEGVFLHWNPSGAADFDHYNLYRTTSPGIDLTGVTPLAQPTDNNYQDISGVAGTDYYYRVAAEDVHTNEGGYSNEETVEFPTPTFLAGYQAVPADGGIRLTWQLAVAEQELRFYVLRAGAAEAADPVFHELTEVAIVRDGLDFTCHDTGCEPGGSYRYRVEVADSHLRWPLFATEAITLPASRFALFQNAPNPFNPSTTIRYELSRPGTVHLAIYSLDGRLVSDLVAGHRQGAGTHQVVWDGRDRSGHPVTSGVYVYRLQAEGFSASRRLLLLK